MDRGEELLEMVDAAEAELNYMYVFSQETGEEAIVHPERGETLADVIDRHPEWSYRYSEAIRDDKWYEWEAARNEYRFWLDTKDMTDEEYDDYLDSLNSDYELDDCYDY
jgi:hypothetical protein